MTRVCVECGSDKTYIKPNGKPNWYGKYCKKCYMRLFTNPARDPNDKHMRNKRRLRFKDKRIMLKDNPRKGICKYCGREGLTNIHHEYYHDDDPLKDTVEICPRCHAKITFAVRS